MATEEGWVGIAEVAAPLGRREGISNSPGGTLAAIQALGSGRVGEGRRK